MIYLLLLCYLLSIYLIQNIDHSDQYFHLTNWLKWYHRRAVRATNSRFVVQISILITVVRIIDYCYSFLKSQLGTFHYMSVVPVKLIDYRNYMLATNCNYQLFELNQSRIQNYRNGLIYS